MKERYALIIIMLMNSFLTFSQKKEEVKADYIYQVPENITLEEAKRTALERAKITAIEKTFGTLVTQNNSTLMLNENGKNDTHFFSLGGSEVKGEWLETTKEPVYDIRYENGMIIVAVEVHGIIREIVNNGVDYVCKILRNGTDEKFESNNFRNGDDMYLYFKSPINGYLLAYLYDEMTNHVVRILPYIKSAMPSFPIKGGEDYVFFKRGSITDYMVDEYTLTASLPVEFNTLYIVFSPDSIIKANDNSDESKDGIRILDYYDFNKWLVGIKKHSLATIKEYTIKICK